jgi:hypothetical protein
VQYEREETDLAKYLVEHDLQGLYPLAAVQLYLLSALQQVGITLLWTASLFNPKAGTSNMYHSCLVTICGALQGESADDVIAWLQTKAGDAATCPEFAQYVTLEVLKSKLGHAQVNAH